MDDLVSVIVANYNCEKYISQTIDSVLAQTYLNWELLIIDDCSKDNSIEIIKAYAERDRRIKLLKTSMNSGSAGLPRSIGVENAKGRYLAFLDSDDIWEASKLHVQIEFMKENNYYFTFTSYSFIDESGIKLNRSVIVPYEVDYNKLLKNTIIGCFTVIIDRENVRNISFLPIKFEDLAAWLSILRTGVKAYGLNKVLGYYRKHTKSISGGKFKAIGWTWKIYRNQEKLNFFKAVYCFFFYIKNAIKKHYF